MTMLLNDPSQMPRGATVSGAEPLYLAIYESFKERIRSGEWFIGGSLPSESALSGHYGVSRITIRHALRLLESDGLIRKEKARRSVVLAAEAMPRRLWSIESIDDIAAQVGDAELKVHSWQREVAPGEAKAFGLAPSALLWCLRGVLTREGRAFTRSIIFFPPQIGSRLKREHFNNVVVFRVLKRELGIDLAEFSVTVSAELASDEDRRSLGLAPASPVLVTRFGYHDENGRLVEVAYSRRDASEADFTTRVSAIKKPA
jgi:GntR family transcriptional regulator